MTGYLVRRLWQAVPILFGVTLLAFLIVRLAPGDPASLLVDMSGLTEAERLAVRESFGLEDAWFVQYWRMITLVVTGDLRSIVTGRSTLAMVGEAVPVTLVLVVLSIVVSLVLGVAAGIVSARRPRGPADTTVLVVALVGLSIPQFWLGLMLILVFAQMLGWLPASGLGPVGTGEQFDLFTMARHLVLPTIALSASVVAAYARYSRSALLENLGEEYIRVARGKGLSERRILLVHALRNSLITVATISGILVPVLLSTTVVIESVFGIPGLGRVAVDAALQRDYPVVFTTTLVAASVVLVANLVTDLLYPVIDPRIKLET